MPLLAGESSKIFHIDLKIWDKFQSEASSPAFNAPQRTCRLPLPRFTNSGYSFFSWFLWKFSIAQFVMGPSMGEMSHFRHNCFRLSSNESHKFSAFGRFRNSELQYLKYIINKQHIINILYIKNGSTVMHMLEKNLIMIYIKHWSVLYTVAEKPRITFLNSSIRLLL